QTRRERRADVKEVNHARVGLPSSQSAGGLEGVHSDTAPEAKVFCHSHPSPCPLPVEGRGDSGGFPAVSVLNTYRGRTVPGAVRECARLEGAWKQRGAVLRSDGWLDEAL